MPEGPEVKTVATSLGSAIIGKKLGVFWHSNQSLRRSIKLSALRKLENSEIDQVSCYGKVLFLHAQKRPIIVAQLGMTGRLLVCGVEDPLPLHTHIRWRLLGTPQEIRYIDPRRFGVFDACDEKERDAIIKKLGPDPFSMKKKDHLPLIHAMKRSRRAIKDVLLDQSIIAGVGNIYASESLFISGINPYRRACDLEEIEHEVLISSIINVLKNAYKNCGTTFSDYVDAQGQKGKNLQFLRVFKRENEPCEICRTVIKRIKQGGRSTFYCEKCQK